jgi:hypothetical protein
MSPRSTSDGYIEVYRAPEVEYPDEPTVPPAPLARGVGIPAFELGAEASEKLIEFIAAAVAKVPGARETLTRTVGGRSPAFPPQRVPVWPAVIAYLVELSGASSTARIKKASAVQLEGLAHTLLVSLEPGPSTAWKAAEAARKAAEPQAAAEAKAATRA